MLIARDGEAHRRLAAMIKGRRSRASTSPWSRAGRRARTIDAPLGRATAPPSGRFAAAGRGCAHPLHRARGPSADALVEAGSRPAARTGSAHFAAIGHPIAGDQRYGHAGRRNLERQFLHSAGCASTTPSRARLWRSTPSCRRTWRRRWSARGARLSPIRSGARIGWVGGVYGRVIGAPAPISRQSTGAPTIRPSSNRPLDGRTGPCPARIDAGSPRGRGAGDEAREHSMSEPGLKDLCRRASISATRRAAGIRACVATSTASATGSTSSTCCRPSSCWRGAALRRGDRRQGRLDSLRRHEEAGATRSSRGPSAATCRTSTSAGSAGCSPTSTISARIDRLHELNALKEGVSSTCCRPRSACRWRRSSRSSSTTSAACGT